MTPRKDVGMVEVRFLIFAFLTRAAAHSAITAERLRAAHSFAGLPSVALSLYL